MPFANLMGSLLCREAQKIHEAERKTSERHLAVLILSEFNDAHARFLLKKIGQGQATCEWTTIHSTCLRLTVSYRGRTWNIRVPVPE